MTSQPCLLIGAPVDSGKRTRGCLMGPDAFRTAGLADQLQSLGFSTRDHGNVAQAPLRDLPAPGKVHALADSVAWT